MRATSIHLWVLMCGRRRTSCRLAISVIRFAFARTRGTSRIKEGDFKSEVFMAYFDAMSRSRRSNPVSGITTAESEKQDKRKYNRRFCRACKQTLETLSDGRPVPILREFSNPWSMGKDRKIRFDPIIHPKLMRKQSLLTPGSNSSFCFLHNILDRKSVVPEHIFSRSRSSKLVDAECVAFIADVFVPAH
jgi:hypothetical protein